MKGPALNLLDIIWLFRLPTLIFLVIRCQTTSLNCELDVKVGQNLMICFKGMEYWSIIGSLGPILEQIGAWLCLTEIREQCCDVFLKFTCQKCRIYCEYIDIVDIHLIGMNLETNYPDKPKHTSFMVCG